MPTRHPGSKHRRPAACTLLRGISPVCACVCARDARARVHVCTCTCMCASLAEAHLEPRATFEQPGGPCMHESRHDPLEDGMVSLLLCEPRVVDEQRVLSLRDGTCACMGVHAWVCMCGWACMRVGGHAWVGMYACHAHVRDGHACTCTPMHVHAHRAMSMCAMAPCSLATPSSVRRCMHARVCMHVRMHACMNACVRVAPRWHACTYVCMHVCMHARVHACVAPRWSSALIASSVRSTENETPSSPRAGRTIPAQKNM